MILQHTISLVPDSTLTEVRPGEWILNSPAGRWLVEETTPGFLQAIRVMLTPGATEGELFEVVLGFDGRAGLSRFHECFQQLVRLGMICRTLQYRQSSVATIVPLSRDYQFRPWNNRPVAQKYQLSRFAYLRREKEQVILESPLAHAKVILHDRRCCALVADLSKPTRECELTRRDLPQEVVSELVTFLLNANALSPVDDDTAKEDTDTVLMQWDFHDLLFHSRSRLGRHRNPYGGTYRFCRKINPLPAIKPDMSVATITLCRADIAALEKQDLPFTWVLEERRSFRTYGNEPITAKELGEFLYRTARTKRQMKDGDQEVSFRPYPSGGALHELELYLVINKCSGIPSGLYHYSPDTHQLSRCADRTLVVEALLEDAAKAAGTGEIQVLFIIAARFQRVAWKYASIAYAVILKDVGVLLQTMYLVATAMGLAGCALGGGDSDLFARAAGTRYLAETSVGEFLLGTTPKA